MECSHYGKPNQFEFAICLISLKAWCIFVIVAGSMGYLLSVVLGLNDLIAYPISFSLTTSLTQK
jgi:Na+/melibiose symporter-like transporter